MERKEEQVYLRRLRELIGTKRGERAGVNEENARQATSRSTRNKLGERMEPRKTKVRGEASLVCGSGTFVPAVTSEAVVCE